MKTVKFKNLELKNPLIMSPLCGVTDLPYRSLVVEQGASLVHTQMVSCAALVRGQERTFGIMDLSPDERPVGVQLFGCKPWEMSEAARIVEARGADLVSINFGCPVPKVIKHNGGSGMLREPETLQQVVKAVVDATSLPVVPKIRTGWDKDSVNAVDIARRVEQAGAHGIAVHGRTRAQGYGGQADWDLIAEIKKAVSIPVIGNGDLFEPADITRAMEQSGVDAVMIGRGGMGNPWLFSRTLEWMEKGEAPGPTSAVERVRTLKRHNQLMFDYKGPHGLAEMRKHAMWYLKGLPHASEVRAQINRTLDRETVFEILDEYLQRLENQASAPAPRAA